MPLGLGFRDRMWRSSFELVKEHAALVEETVSELVRALKAKADGRDAEALRVIGGVRASEEAADSKRREVVASLGKGVLPPLSRQDVIHLVRRLDRIADSAMDAARYLTHVRFHGELSVLAEDLVKMAEADLETVKSLRRAIDAIGSDYESCSRHCDEVEEGERLCDSLHMRALRTFSGMNPPSGLASVVAELIEELENIADFCEDASDVLRAIVVRMQG